MDLYFETYSGIAGDMTVGALLDLGADKEIFINALKSMNFGNYELIFERCRKKGIDAYNFDVVIKDHHHAHEEHHHEEHHHHRNLKDIIEIINSGNFSEKAKENAKKIFNIIAEAEAKAHGTTVDEIHFHEVGAVDSIIDVVGVCVLIDSLNPEHIYFTDLYEGKGFVKCAHGIMPVPAPAVLNIIKNEGLSLKIIDDEGEHVTPTGAAIAALFGEGMPPYSFKIKKIGIGAGNRDFENTTNILRVMEIENSKKKI